MTAIATTTASRAAVTASSTTRVQTSTTSTFPNPLNRGQIGLWIPPFVGSRLTAPGLAWGGLANLEGRLCSALGRHARTSAAGGIQRPGSSLPVQAARRRPGGWTPGAWPWVLGGRRFPGLPSNVRWIPPRGQSSPRRKLGRLPPSRMTRAAEAFPGSSGCETRANPAMDSRHRPPRWPSSWVTAHSGRLRHRVGVIGAGPAHTQPEETPCPTRRPRVGSSRCHSRTRPSSSHANVFTFDPTARSFIPGHPCGRSTDRIRQPAAHGARAPSPSSAGSRVRRDPRTV